MSPSKFDPESFEPFIDPNAEDPTYPLDPERTQKMTLPRGLQRRSTLHHVLRVVAGPDMLRFLCLEPASEVTIGRDDTADLYLADPSVSRQHALIQCSPTGELTVIDRDSMNGTRINDRIVHKARLNVGDPLEVGHVSLRVDLLSDDEIAHLRRVSDRLKLSEGKDPLTGLRLRTYLDAELPALVQSWQARGLPATCAFMDIDHFKKINDTLGHQVGDEVIRTIARLVMLHSRDSDACFRYGGEEFVILLLGTPADGGMGQARRLCTTIQGHDWARTCAGLRRVTASFGVAEPSATDTSPASLNRADQAMYQAQHESRNRVVQAH